MNVVKTGGHIKYNSVDKAVTQTIPSSLSALPVGAFLIGSAANKTKHDWGYTISFSDVTWSCMVRPQEYQVGLQDVDLEAGRTATGIMVRHKKGIKRAISAKTPPLASSEISVILKAIDPNDTPTSTSSSETTAAGMRTCFAVAYHDPWVGGPTCKVMYSGDRIAPMYNGAMNLWENLQLEFVEM
jgi:hypothetical protein